MGRGSEGRATRSEARWSSGAGGGACSSGSRPPKWGRDREGGSEGRATPYEAHVLNKKGQPMSTVDLNAKIPNNVNLDQDKRLLRALEQWQPNYIKWWMDMGPHG